MIARVTYDKDSECGALIISITFERGLPKEAYEGRMKYILSLGGTEEEARAYAGYLDYPKPSVAIAEMNSIAPNSGVNWQKLISQAIKDVEQNTDKARAALPANRRC